MVEEDRRPLAWDHAGLVSLTTRPPPEPVGTFVLYATRAFRAGKSLPWLPQQPAHTSPELTLTTDSDNIPEEESGASLADFGASEQHDPAPGKEKPRSDTSSAYLNNYGH